MEDLQTFTWQKNYTLYSVALFAFILLLLVGRYDNQFTAWISDGATDDLLSFMSLHTMLLFIVDFSLTLGIATPLTNEDERVEKIRGFALKQTFLIGCLMATGLGFFMNVNFSLLNYAAIIQVYYILLFELLLYRDSQVIYLTQVQREAKVAANKNKLIIFGLVQGLLQGALMAYLGNHHYESNVLWISMAVYFGILSLVVSVYSAWKK